MMLTVAPLAAGMVRTEGVPSEKFVTTERSGWPAVGPGGKIRQKVETFVSETEVMFGAMVGSNDSISNGGSVANHAIGGKFDWNMLGPRHNLGGKAPGANPAILPTNADSRISPCEA
jgi:hypothetical protein